MAFSGGLRLTDLNDFITPSQECVKPVESKKKSKDGAANGGDLRVDASTGDYFQVSLDGQTETKLEKAEITLNDCLACSGCITSAESVLIEQQSHKELYAVLSASASASASASSPSSSSLPSTTATAAAGDSDVSMRRKLIVVSVSPQTRAALARKYGLDQLTVARRITAFLKQLGVHLVLDTSLARDIALLEGAREFVDRYRQQNESQTSMPMLASACPGWVCYAEKTHGNLLPYISTTKSPQQVMGSLVKYHIGKQHDCTPDQVYHVSVMPCYDKKLEASRDDFYSDIYRTRDVDCVITTGELEKMFSEQLANLVGEGETASILSYTKEAPLDTVSDIREAGSTDCITRSPGTSSGGYLEYIMRYAAKELFGVDDADVPSGNGGIKTKVVRSSDYREVTLTVDGKPALVFIAAYGFRNIQNIVRKMKLGRLTCHFVEVMACPSGCINGGGQPKPIGGDAAVTAVGKQAKEWVAGAEAEYSLVETRQPEENDEAVRLIEQWLGGLGSTLSQQILHTQYHAVPNFYADQEEPNVLAAASSNAW
ncbi:iron hydrogenase [Ramicandelaber brevisporus]|nr:iron hydrogenase [Ramicandelaber brevisporus]